MEEKLKLEEAKNLLLKEQQEKLAACQAEIATVLQKYGFTLQVQQSIVLVPAG